MSNKNVKYVNLGEMQDFPEEFVLAKIDIESLENSPERKNLIEFMSTLDMSSIYVNAGNMISFTIKEGRENIYIFYMILSTPYVTQVKTNEENLEAFSNVMKKLDNNISRLTKKSVEQLLEGDLNYVQRGEYFIMNNEFYTI